MYLVAHHLMPRWLAINAPLRGFACGINVECKRDDTYLPYSQTLTENLSRIAYLRPGILFCKKCPEIGIKKC